GFKERDTGWRAKVPGGGCGRLPDHFRAHAGTSGRQTGAAPPFFRGSRSSPPLRSCPRLTRSNRRGTDPYARWCGRGGAARCPPIPINKRLSPRQKDRLSKVRIGVFRARPERASLPPRAPRPASPQGPRTSAFDQLGDASNTSSTFQRMNAVQNGTYTVQNFGAVMARPIPPQREPKTRSSLTFSKESSQQQGPLLVAFGCSPYV